MYLFDLICWHRVVAAVMPRVGLGVLGAYLLAINVVTFVAFGIDKRRAVEGRWRIREHTLLVLSLLGGTIGGLVGMVAFRHKIRKPKFRYGMPAILVLQLVVVFVLMLQLPAA